MFFKFSKVFVSISLLSSVFVPCQLSANVLGTDAQNFNPTSGGLDFVTVHSSQVLERGYMNFGLFLNMASNTLPLLASYSTQSLARSHDRLYSLDFNASYGLFRDWEIGINAPYLLDQETSNCEACGLFKTTGFTETRAYIKNGNYKFGEIGAAWVASVSKNLIDDNPFAGRNAGVTTTLEVAVDRYFGEILVAMNMGYRWRQPGEKIAKLNEVFSRISNQFIYSMAMSRYVDAWNSNFIWEIFGSKLAENNLDGVNESNRHDSSLETLVGVKHMWNHQLAIHGGAGTEIIHGFGTPDLRLYTGLNYSIGPKEALAIRQEDSPTKIDGQIEKTYTLLNLKFEFDSTALTKDSLESYEKFIKEISEIKNLVKVIVEGHTDSIGKAEYNRKLSQRRADYLKNEILKVVDKRTPPVELVSEGFGSSQPIASNSNFQGRAKNRRVIIRTFTKN